MMAINQAKTFLMAKNCKDLHFNELSPQVMMPFFNY
jgi:hypothetical protein